MFGEGLTEIITAGGLLVIMATIFTECAFLFGFFLPGDSLLFLAGFLAGQGQYNIALTIFGIFFAATVGNVTGYYIGKKAGPRVFTKEDGIFFKKEHILQAQKFYTKHGGKTLILARFVPVMRTFAPFVGGIGNMPFSKFFFYSTVGAGIWAVSITLLGFWAYRVLGHSIDIEHYVMPIVIAIMAFSIGGSVFHAIRESRKNTKKIAARELEEAQDAADEQID